MRVLIAVLLGLAIATTATATVLATAAPVAASDERDMPQAP
jgi:hypothetical protein